MILFSFFSKISIKIPSCGPITNPYWNGNVKKTQKAFSEIDTTVVVTRSSGQLTRVLNYSSSIKTTIAIKFTPTTRLYALGQNI